MKKQKNEFGWKSPISPATALAGAGLAFDAAKTAAGATLALGNFGVNIAVGVIVIGATLYSLSDNKKRSRDN